MSEYLGIPQEEWDSLAAEAEDTMLAKGYGQHILGTYPAGPRIFGSTKASPYLFVITIDDPARSLNPFAAGHEPVSDGQLYFVDLYTWVSTLSLGIHDLDPVTGGFPHVIPVLGPPHYEDSQLTELIYLAEVYLKARGWDDVIDLPCSRVHHAAFMRARYLLEITGKFAPCLNKDWVTVKPVWGIPSECEDYDSLLIEHVVNGTMLSEAEADDVLDYCHLLYEELCGRSRWEEAEEEERLLGEAVKRFYTRLM